LDLHTVEYNSLLCPGVSSRVCKPKEIMELHTKSFTKVTRAHDNPYLDGSSFRHNNPVMG
jgi:hypothetical protein